MTWAGHTHRCSYCGASFIDRKRARKYCSRKCCNTAQRVLATPIDPRVRFMAKVQVTESCWLWMGGGRRHGIHRGLTVAAHRYSYEMFVGPIAAGLQLDHLCRVPACVRPDHLEPVTPRENTLRGVGTSAQNAKRTTCLRGHAFDLIDKAGKRGCRQCNSLREKAYRERRRAAAQ